MKLFHGSNIEINRIDLNKCRPYKDFGRGFYLTSIELQARKMADNTARLYGGEPVVTVFDFDESLLECGDLKVRLFPSVPTVEWALFINNNRRREAIDIESSECNKDNKYDIVVGPVADDKISVTLRRYLGQQIDLAGLKRQLTYKELTNQYSFHTDRAIACLRKAGSLDG